MARASARALWYESPGKAALRPVDPGEPGEGEVLVETGWSAISRGTERLVSEGRVPQSEHQRMRAPFQKGDFPFPVKYGYCAAGTVIDGPPDMCGREVFVLHPHQTRFTVAADKAIPLPEGLPLRRACLAANMETALNALWDSAAAPGDQIVVIGAGLVGALTAWLCARMPGTGVSLVDINPARSELAAALDIPFAMPAEVPHGGADVVFHASASPEGLQLALECAGFEGRVVEMSWYGDDQIPVPLGATFHSQRLQLVSTQVGQISPGHRARWSYSRRLSKALELLRDDRLDALITHEFAFEDAPNAVPRFLHREPDGLAAVLRYPKQA